MHAEANVVRMRHPQAGCERCNQNRLCLASGLTEAERRTFADNLRFVRPYERGQYLYRAGEPLRHLAIVRSGSFKSIASTREGLEQIVGLHLPGDLMGIDAMGAHRHPTSAVALETTSVCLIPWEALDRLLRTQPALLPRFLTSIGSQIANENVRIVLLSQASARERLAAFLLHVSREHQRRGFSATEFNLSTSRQEIANYLALAIETVSRLFTAFQQEGLIAVDRRFVRIMSLEALGEVGDAEPVRAAS